MKSKEEEKSAVTMFRGLEVNTGLNLIIDNKTISRVQSFKIGIFKADLEKYVNQYQKELVKLEEDYEEFWIKDKDITIDRNNRAGYMKHLPKDKKVEYNKKKQDLLDVEIPITLVTFKLDDFKDVADITPAFYTYMKDLITV